MVYTRRIATSIEKAYGKLDKLTYLHGLRSFVGLSLPDFLGIGPTKTGTTWLAENLRCHPGVYMCKEKELHYFNHNFHKTLIHYSDKFRHGVGKIKGEITPEYYSLPLKNIRFIKTVMPEVKLILLVRNPIDRAWSHAVMSFSLKNKDIMEAKEEDVVEVFQKQIFFRLGGYREILNSWYSVFSSENLYIGLYDDISKRPRNILKEIFSHINVSTEIDWNMFPYNEVIIPPVGVQYKDHDKSRGVVVKKYKNTKYFMPEKYKLVLREMYRKDIESMQEIFGDRLTNWLHS